MPKRYIYSLLFGIPGLFIAGMAAIFLFAGLTWILGIYVFGDEAWPTYTEQVLSTLFILTVLTFWLVAIVVGYVVGMRLERAPAMNRTHILISAGLTLLFLLLMAAQQFGAVILGPRQDSALCRDFCTMHGYAGSRTAPELSGNGICSCYDESGSEVLRIPLDHLNREP